MIFLSLEMAVHGLKLWASCEIMESSFVVKVLGDSSSKIPPPLTLVLNTLDVVMHILLCEVNATHLSSLLLQHLC